MRAVGERRLGLHTAAFHRVREHREARRTSAGCPICCRRGASHTPRAGGGRSGDEESVTMSLYYTATHDLWADPVIEAVIVASEHRRRDLATAVDDPAPVTVFGGSLLFDEQTIAEITTRSQEAREQIAASRIYFPMQIPLTLAAAKGTGRVLHMRFVHPAVPCGAVNLQPSCRSSARSFHLGAVLPADYLHQCPVGQLVDYRARGRRRGEDIDQRVARMRHHDCAGLHGSRGRGFRGRGRGRNRGRRRALATGPITPIVRGRKPPRQNGDRNRHQGSDTNDYLPPPGFHAAILLAQLRRRNEQAQNHENTESEPFHRLLGGAR
ncbi:porin PorA family protein [Nocardia amikacinitolerans]|uniref:porin PorA family protein n=1 Tax=Nocardia amikacinitolerans TaxID=756689 RepID=UPI003555F07A|nr:Protein of unknown function (DUF3068) [Nocardia amikacinitolerans]